MSKMMPYHSNDHIIKMLGKYDEQTYDQLPHYLKQQLQIRNLYVKRRGPTDIERLEAHTDAKEHRLMNKERTIEDFKDKYLRGKKFLFD